MISRRRHPLEVDGLTDAERQRLGQVPDIFRAIDGLKGMPRVIEAEQARGKKEGIQSRREKGSQLSEDETTTIANSTQMPKGAAAGGGGEQRRPFRRACCSCGCFGHMQ